MNTLTQGKMALETIYSTFFFALDGYSTGNPERAHRLAWKYWLIPAIDIEYNKEAQIKAKLILKENPVSKESILFIKEELRPYFEVNLKRHTQKTISMIEKISILKVKENIKRYEKEKKGIYH